MRHIPALLCASLSLTLLSGCSSFNRDWKTTLASPAPATPTAWDGEWHSDMNDHRGRLRCLLSETDTDDILTARFRARYAKVLVFEYSLPIKTEGDAEKRTFTVHADLGESAGGLFDATGIITPTTLTATYTSRWDWGTFDMKAVTP